MKPINKISITSASDVQTIIKINLIIQVDNYEVPFKQVRELHLSKDIPMKINETIFVQNFPCKIKTLHTEIKNGHIYKIANVFFHKTAPSTITQAKQVKEFDKVYSAIVRGLRNKGDDLNE